MTETKRMTTTRDELPMGKRRGKAAESRLVTAYQNVFKNLGVNADVDLVLADLAEYSGYFATCPDDVTANQLFLAEGQRKVFARILSLLGVSGEDRELLRRAALDELYVSHEEGSR